MQNETLDAALMQDVLRAYRDGGGYKVFVNDERLLEAVLLKLFKQEAPQPMLILDLVQEIPWMNWGDRLAYKQGALVGNVEDVAFRAMPSSVAHSTEHQDSSAAPSATPSVLPDHRPTSAKRADEFLNQAWKAEPEDKGLAAIMRHPDKP